MKPTFAENKYRRSKRALLVYLSFSIALLVFSTLYSFRNFGSFRFPNATSVVVTLTFLALAAILADVVSRYLDKKVEKISKDAERSKRGVDGENVAKLVILETIGTEYEVFFNKELPGGGDIDCLILGKKGLILIEVKNFEKQQNLYSKMRYDPRAQARRHVRRLKEYFRKQGLIESIHIHLAVLYINPKLHYWGKQNGVYNILGTNNFEKYFKGLQDDTTLSTVTMAQIRILVERLG